MKIIIKSSLFAFFLSVTQMSFAGSFIDSATVVSVDKVYKQVRVEEPYQECYIKETVQNNGDGSATNEIIGGAGGAGGGDGGSGVVILRMATSDYTGTKTGSPTVSTDGSDTILVYTASGTYTA